MSAKSDLFRIVRSEPFTRMTRADQIESVVGYFNERQSSAAATADFKSFNPAKQREIAEAAIQRLGRETTGETLQRSSETAGPALGGMVGAHIGSPLGIPGVVAGGVAGGIVGEFAPEMLRPFTEQKSADLGAALERSAETGLISLALGPLEGAAGAVSKVVGGGRSRFFKLRPFKDERGRATADPEVTAAREVLEPRGGGLTPGQQRGTGRGFFENISRNAILGEGRFADLDLANEQAIDQFADEIGERIGQSLPASEVGTFFREAVTKGGKLARQAGSALFQRVDDEAGGIQTIQDDVMDFIQAKSKIPAMKAIFGKFNAGPTGGRKGLEALLGKNSNGLAEFQDADLAAGELFAAARDLRKAGETGAANVATKLGAMIRTNIDTAIEQLDPAIKTQAQQARQFWKDNVVEGFEAEVLRPLLRTIRTEPGQASRIVLDGGIDMLRAVKKIAQTEVPGHGTTWPEVQRSILATLLTRAKDPVIGNFNNIQKVNGRKLLEQLKSLDEFNSGFVKELTDGTATVSDFRKLANAIDLADRKVSGSGGVFMRLSQSSEAVKGLQLLGTGGAVATGNTVAGVTGFLIAPWLLARWFTNRTAMKNLAEGLIGGPKSAAARRLVSLAALESDKARQEFRANVGDVRPEVRAGARQLRDVLQQGLPPLAEGLQRPNDNTPTIQSAI